MEQIETELLFEVRKGSDGRYYGMSEKPRFCVARNTRMDAAMAAVEAMEFSERNISLARMRSREKELLVYVVLLMAMVLAAAYFSGLFPR